MKNLPKESKNPGRLLEGRAKYSGALLRLTDLGLIALVLPLICSLMSWSVSSIYGWKEVYLAPSLIAMLCFLLAGEYNGLYRIWRSRSIWSEWSRVLGSWLITIPALLTLAYVTKTSFQYSRILFILWFICAPIAIMIWRGLLRTTIRQLRKKGLNTKRIAIAGTGEAAQSIIDYIQDSPWMGYELAGSFHGIESGETSLHQLLIHAKNNNFDAVYIAYPLGEQEFIQHIIGGLANTNVQVYLLPGLFMSGLLQSQWSELGTLPVIDIFSSPMRGTDGAVKRLFDLGVCATLIPLLALPMLLIALCVKFQSKGPSLFRQKRYGIDGKEINVLKFRTMVESSTDQAPEQARPNDARVTSLGKWLRSSSLDELPQLFNVLRGDMSLVGPRPHAVEHDEYYRELIHGYTLRQRVRPGITGLAQVNGWRGRTEVINKMSKRVEFDLYYIRNWSIGLDVKILFLTLRYGFNSKNAF